MIPPSRRSAATFLALGAILLAGLGLRVYRLGEPSVWWDELFAITASAGHVGDWFSLPNNRVIEHPPDLTGMSLADPWRQTWRTPDIHPPLYAAILRVWRTLFGDGDIAARSLSVFASMLAIVLLFDAVRTLFGVGPALWACALMATAQYQIIYAQEATSYAVLTAFGVGAMAATGRLFKNGFSWPAAIATGVCLMALPMIHYYAIGPVVAMLILGLSGLRRRVLIPVGAGLAASGAIILILFYGHIASEIHWIATNAHWMHEESAHPLKGILVRLVRLPIEFLGDSALLWTASLVIGAIVYLTPFTVMRRQPAMWLCGLFLLGSVGVGAMADLLTHSDSLEYVRFSLLGAPVVYAIIAGLPLKQQWLRHAIPAVALLICLESIPAAYEFPRDSKGDWRGVGCDVAAKVRSGDMLVFASAQSDFLSSPMAVYGYVRFYSGPIPCPIVLLNSSVTASIESRLKEARHVWVIGCIPVDRSHEYLPDATLTPAAAGHRLAGQLYQAEWR